MPLCLLYDPVYFYERATPNGDGFEHTEIDFAVFEDGTDGQVPGTRRQSLQQAVQAGYRFRHLQVGGRVGHTMMGRVRYEHNLLCDHHGAGEPSVDVAQQDLEQGHQHQAGDVVYVHWPACGAFPAGWYRARIVVV